MTAQIRILHNPRCRKSRETLDILKEVVTDFTVIEYLKSPPSEQELGELLKKLNIKPLELIRKGEKIYKDKYKGQDLSDEQLIQAMVQNPILIERPIVVKGDHAVIGRHPEKVRDLLD